MFIIIFKALNGQLTDSYSRISSAKLICLTIEVGGAVNDIERTIKTALHGLHCNALLDPLSQ
jgi:hypothetical protein